MSIYLAREAKVALLLTKKVTVPNKYSDFLNIFSKKLANLLQERTGVNEHAIKLKKGKQQPYEPIYSPRPVELEIFKTYIEINLANKVI